MRRVLVLVLAACGPAPLPKNESYGVAARPAAEAPKEVRSARKRPPPPTAPKWCPCSADEVCAPTGKAGEICLSACKVDDDCPETFVCDARWKACAPPMLLAPKLAACSAPVPPRKTFAPPVQISNAPGYQFEPTAALTRKGEVAVVYGVGGPRETPHKLMSALIGKDGSTLMRDQPVAGDSESYFDPWMARGMDGRLHLVWLAFDGVRAPERNMRVAYATSNDGKTWSKPRPVHDAQADCPPTATGCLDKPMVIAGVDRKETKREAVYVLYASDPSGGERLVRSGDGGATFTPSVAVGRDGYGDARVGRSGIIHVVYVVEDGKSDRFGDAKISVEYVRSEDGGTTFALPTRVTEKDEAVPYFFSNPQVLPDDRRNAVHVVYPSGGPDGRWEILVASSRDAGKTWSRVQVNDDLPCAIHMTPMAALDEKTGKLHVAWMENRSGKGDVAYTSCDVTGAVKCAPAETVGGASFGAFVPTRHSPRWLGEYGSLLLDDKTLHLLFTQTREIEGNSVARVFYARGTLKP